MEVGEAWIDRGLSGVHDFLSLSGGSDLIEPLTTQLNFPCRLSSTLIIKLNTFINVPSCQIPHRNPKKALQIV